MENYACLLSKNIDTKGPWNYQKRSVLEQISTNLVAWSRDTCKGYCKPIDVPGAFTLPLKARSGKEAESLELGACVFTSVTLQPPLK